MGDEGEKVGCFAAGIERGGGLVVVERDGDWGAGAYASVIAVWSFTQAAGGGGV